MIGATSHEGTIFVYSAFPKMSMKFMLEGIVLAFFRDSKDAVMTKYEPIIQAVDNSDDPDYRLALANIVGDYLFRCPNQVRSDKCEECEG